MKSEKIQKVWKYYVKKIIIWNHIVIEQCDRIEIVKREFKKRKLIIQVVEEREVENLKDIKPYEFTSNQIELFLKMVNIVRLMNSLVCRKVKGIRTQNIPIISTPGWGIMGWNV